MGSIYQTFLRQGIGLDPLGVNGWERGGTYFCTPVGAEIFGWAGVDGIHYCFIDGFDDMVFAVSPMNLPGEYVHPLARSFEEFLCLLLACGNADALEQTHQWEKPQFDAYLRENPPLPEQQAVLDEIRDKLGLAPIENPFETIKSLQEEFDISRLKFSEEYYELLPAKAEIEEEPEWNVSFEGNFWSQEEKGRAGEEISVEKEFDWGGRRWYVPAVYSCAEGLVIDFCMRVEREAIQAFMEKWGFNPENESAHFGELTREQRMELGAENPMSFGVNPTVVVNGKTLSHSHGCGAYYYPKEFTANKREVQRIMEHYHLDSACSWMIWRDAFPWGTGHQTEIKTLSLHLEQERTALPGPRFRTSSPGGTVVFRHPVTGCQHTLTVLEYERKEVSIPSSAFPNQEMPAHYAAMRYTIVPELSKKEVSVSDCAASDSPRVKQSGSASETGGEMEAAMIGIIGGSDGPTVFLVTEGGEEKTSRTACSSLHFAPVEEVEWGITFHPKSFEKICVCLL